MFGLQGCLSPATLHRPWLPASPAIRGEQAGPDVSRMSCLRRQCTWVRAPTILSSSPVAGSGLGVLRRRGSCCASLRAVSLMGWQMGCREEVPVKDWTRWSGQGSLPPVLLFLRSLLCVSSNKFVTTCSFMVVIRCPQGEAALSKFAFQITRELLT